MPEEAMDELAELWGRAMHTGEVPKAWLEVRTVTIPKQEGGYRGLSIASQIWRACMSATVYLLRDWADGWLPEEVYGGISGRNGNALHERLMGVIDKCNKEGLELRGGKIDLKKCFETVAPEQAITLWEEWGAPRG